MANTYQESIGLNIPWENGAVSLFASAQVNAAATGSLVPVLGNGIIYTTVDVTTITELTAGTNEIYVHLESNTVAVDDTWTKFATLRLDGTIIDTAGEFILMGYNKNDYQVRVDFTVLGSPNVVLAIDAYPLRDQVTA